MASNDVLDTRLQSFYHGKSVLVLGGLGFIGSNLAIQCSRLGARVTIYDALIPQGGGRLANIEHFERSIACIGQSTCDAAEVRGAIIGQDVIFNCAGHTSHSHSMRDPFLDVDINCRGTINVLEAIRHHGAAARVIYIGTSTQCGPMLFSPITETHPEFPRDIYSANKSAAEKYHLIYHRHYGVAASVVRLGNVYGPRANIKSSDGGVLNYFIGLAMEDRELPVYGQGRQRRNILYVDDCVAALLTVAAASDTVGNVYLAVNDNEHTIAEFAEAVCAAMGCGKIAHVPWPQDWSVLDVGDVALSNAKICGATTWRPVTSLAQGLAMTKAFFS